MSSQRSSSVLNSATSEDVGTCSACLRSGIRLTAEGVLYNLGPRDAQCLGEGKPPVNGFHSGATSAVSITCNTLSSVLASSNESTSLSDSSSSVSNASAT